MNQGQPSPAQECHLCGKPGVVLAREVFTWNDPALWFCAEDWPEYEAIYSVVEDRREKQGEIDYTRYICEKCGARGVCEEGMDIFVACLCQACFDALWKEYVAVMTRGGPHA